MDRETARIAKRFAQKIRKVYAPEKIILFGSRARGDNFRKSDFDFIIVSKEFEGVPFIKRPANIYDYWNENFDIEAICYAPKEFRGKAKQCGIISKAIREGIAF